MSSPAAIAAVTRTLAGVIEDALHEEDAAYRVSTLAPDKSNADTQTPNRLNLFLVQPMHNAALRNVNPNYTHRNGSAGPPPLAINLVYMITAYGEPTPETKDQRILGRAMRCLNEHPTLLADDFANHFPGSGLEAQVESVRVSPRDVSLEEMSRMWSTFMTQYRTSAVYDVSVVLIDNTVDTAPGAPVLRRGEEDPGVFMEAGLPPVITAIRTPELVRRGSQVIRQPAILVGQVLTIECDRLPASEAALEVGSPGWGARVATLPAVAAGSAPGTRQVTLTDPPPELAPPAGAAPLAWAPGVYTAAIVVPAAAGPDLVSGVMPFALAPQVQFRPPNAAPGDVAITIDCAPPPRAGQTVRLMLSGRPPLTPTTLVPLQFHAPGLRAGSYLVSLRVDGVDSMPYRAQPLPQGGSTLQYDPAERLVVA